MEQEWTGKDIAKIVTNPAYCLEKIHPFFIESKPPVMSEDEWINTNVKAIETEGAETVLRGIIDNLKNPTTFGYAHNKIDSEMKKEIYGDYKNYCSHVGITPLNFDTIEYHIDDIWEKSPEAAQRAKLLFADKIREKGEDSDFKHPICQFLFLKKGTI